MLEVYSSILSIVQYVNHILNTRYLSHGPIDVLININDINNKNKEVKTILIINDKPKIQVPSYSMA